MGYAELRLSVSALSISSWKLSKALPEHRASEFRLTGCRGVGCGDTPLPQIVHKIRKDSSKTFHLPYIKRGYTETVPKRQERGKEKEPPIILTATAGGEDGIPDHRPAG